METVFETKEQYLEFIEKWKSVTNSELNTALTFENFILYALLRGKDVNKCIASSSSDETIARKDKVLKDWKAEYIDKYPWNGLVTAEMVEKARVLYREKF